MPEIAKPITSAHQTSYAIRKDCSKPSPIFASTSAIGSAGDEAPERGHQLVDLLDLLATVGLDHAVAGVVVDEAQGDLVERRLDRGDLGEDVDAVALLLDHSRDAADLAL